MFSYEAKGKRVANITTCGWQIHVFDVNAMFLLKKQTRQRTCPESLVSEHLQSKDNDAMY